MAQGSGIPARRSELVRSGEGRTVNVAIRADASADIGTGHVMRCLTLANALRGRGATVSFLCREYAGHLCSQVEADGFAVHRLPVLAASPSHASLAVPEIGWELDAEQSRIALEHAGMRPELLVVDHYGLGRPWERALRPLTRRILVIDDLADRPHDCDVLLDPNLHDSPNIRYVGLVAASTRVFVGPRYALLRPEFDLVAARTRDSGLSRMLIFFGGADSSNEALKLVHALRGLAERAPPTVIVLGAINSNVEELRRTTLGMDRIQLVVTTGEMARLMDEADLGVGTCGSAAWERCLLGLPALVVVSAENQRDDARILHSLGAVRNLGDASDTSVKRWIEEIGALQKDSAALQAMSRAATAVMRGRQQAVREFESALAY
jgi:UDP-2,4-diacetamido-2,4,6-trideoxy-beta-L-altropyranose hydrolase